MVQQRQCGACPWRRSTVPDRDIPGYDEGLHRGLDSTIAEPGDLGGRDVVYGLDAVD